MWSAQRRLQYIKNLWKEGLWGVWLGAVYFVLNFFVFIRDDFWRPADAGRWSLINMTPHLSLAWWLFGYTLIFFVWVFESSYRTYKRQIDQNDVLEREKDDLLNKMTPKLRILFDEDEPYIVSTGPDEGQAEQLISVGVENVGGIFLEHCQVRLQYGPIRSRFSAMISSRLSCEPFSLLPEDAKLIHILSIAYPEFSRGSDYLSTVCFAEDQDGWSRSFSEVLLPGTHKITVEAFSANSMRFSLDLIASHENGKWLVKNIPS